MSAVPLEFSKDIQEVQDELHDVQEIVATSHLDPTWSELLWVNWVLANN